ncbi:hypothetical protein EJB05_19031, partial [Eragrostis curvula]
MRSRQRRRKIPLVLNYISTPAPIPLRVVVSKIPHLLLLPANPSSSGVAASRGGEASMADARTRASKNASGDKGSTSTRPARLRVMRPDVQEVLKSPRRSRSSKKKQHPPPSPPRPPSPSPPPRQDEEEEEEEGVGEEEFERARYDCGFQDEGEGGRDFAPPDLVWGKVRSHPWWPGQVFDPADASEVALQHRRPGAPLVAYFWDRTFAWNDASALLPFRANFTRFSAQSTMSGFVSAVDAALQEVGRRVETGLCCGCFGSTIATKQEVENSGVRQGAFGAVVDGAYMRDAFRGKAFLDYISALGKKPMAGADLLDLAIIKAQLRAFNRSRGPRGLPEFVVFEGIDDVADATPHTKRKRMHKSSDNDVLSKEKKSRHSGSSSVRNEAFPESTNEEVMDAPTADEDTISKGNKSKGTKSSTKKKPDISKHLDRLERAVLVGSRTPAGNAVNDVLSESNSGRMLRSTRKKEDALEGLKKLGRDGGAETFTGSSKDNPLLTENKLRRRASATSKKDETTEYGDGLGDGSAKDSPDKRRSERADKSASKRVLISEQGRKKKKLSELMAEAGRPNSARPGRKNKTRGTPSLHESAEDPNCDSKDTVKTRKRKKLDTLGDLSSLSGSLSRKKSTKVGELMTKASRRMPQTPPSVKANGKASQIKSCSIKHKQESAEEKLPHSRHKQESAADKSPRSRHKQESAADKLPRSRHKQESAADKSPRSVKANRGKKDAFTEDFPSCSEMLWQLSLASCDLKLREKIAPTVVNFFTDFRKNSNVSSSDVGKRIPEKAADTESTPLEQPIADHMQDDYWADILINVEEPLSSLKKKKDESNKRTSKKAHQVKKLSDKSSVTLESADEPRGEGKLDTENGKHLNAESKPFVANGSQLNAGTKSAEDMENSLQAGLVLHFSRPSAVPSRSDLIKIFSQYGPVKEAKAEIANNANSAQVIFKRRMDAEAAFAGAGKISALGPALDSFRLTDFPAAASGNESSHGASKSE